MLERVVWVSVGTTGPGEMLRRKGLLEENWDAGEGARGPVEENTTSAFHIGIFEHYAARFPSYD